MASEKITALIEEVKALTVLELSELVKALEEEFGVSAAAMAAPAAGGAAAEAAEEKTEFDVVLAGFDAAAKIKVIKAVREITGLGLAAVSYTHLDVYKRQGGGRTGRPSGAAARWRWPSRSWRTVCPTGTPRRGSWRRRRPPGSSPPSSAGSRSWTGFCLWERAWITSARPWRRPLPASS